MLTLVTGGSASGKSEYAESLVCKSANQDRLYIATMQPFDEECKARIAKHQTMRQNKGFRTLECYLDLASAQINPGALVLLECLSNLVANEIFDPKGAGANAAGQILAGINKLCLAADQVIIVSNEVFADGVTYDKSMANYLQILGDLNCKLAIRADLVVEVVCGIPIFHKQNPRRDS